MLVEDERQGVIVRRDPPTSLIDTERAHEFKTYQAVYGSVIPVPEPIALEERPDVLNRVLKRPFSITREIAGCESATSNFALPEYRPLRQKIGQQKWTVLGNLARLAPEALQLDFMELPSHPAREALEYWSAVVAEDALHPQPIAEAAIRHLQRELPDPSADCVLVHGDYRSGNFLYDQDGTIQGVLDWEMAHLGDPLEDLAWSMDPLWCFPEKTLAGGLLPRADALAIWERASGITVDAEAFRWWQIFASLKALAIWISSAESFVNGATKDPILAYAGWPLIDRQNRILLDRLDPNSRYESAEAIL